jgi:excinuclease ABC subunit B
VRAILDMRGSVIEADYHELPMLKAAGRKDKYGKGKAHAEAELIPPDEIPRMLKDYKEQMMAAAEALNFEKAAQLRDKIKALEQMALLVG